MERIKILDWVLDIDYEKTIQHYSSLPYITDKCTCSNCINFVRACDLLDPEIKFVLNKLGIELSKADEIFYCKDNDDGTSLYWAGCNIIGKIVEGPDKIKEVVKENGELGNPKIKVPVKKKYLDGFDMCFYTLAPRYIDGIEYSMITLDINVVLKRLISNIQ